MLYLSRVTYSFALWLFVTGVALAAGFVDGQKAYQDGDYQQALEIIKPLADEGDSRAQALLAIMYDQGRGVEKNAQTAFSWYLKAATQGLPMAQHDVGVKYFQGNGTEQDYREAAQWWEQSATAGLADSQFNLGLMYYRGLGVALDYPKAAALFHQAAEQDHAQAQYSLAVMQAFGQGMDQDYAKALQWFQKAAAQGIAQAQFNLGVFYENGYSVEKNPGLARQWYQRAADQGLEAARKKLVDLDAQTTTQPLEHAIAHPAPGGLPATGAETPAAATPAPTAPAPAATYKREDWIWQQRPNTYTLQLVSLPSEPEALAFLKQHELASKAAYIKVVIEGATRYNVIYGVFNTYDQARQALKTLPQDLQKEKPWVRNFGLLQKMLKTD